MPDQDIDVMMRVVNNGRALQAESRTVFAIGNTVDALRADFDPGQFCDLKEFSFSVGTGSGSGGLGSHTPASPFEAQVAKALAKTQPPRKPDQNKYGPPDSVDCQPVEYTRVFDTASTLMFQALVECDTLDSISIVKRKAAGTSNSGEIFLRLDFTKVLLTDLDWKDAEHIVEETGTFIYRQLAVRYRPQMAGGSLGTIIPMTWKMKT